MRQGALWIQEKLVVAAYNCYCAQMRAAAGASDAFTVGKTKTGAMHGAYQQAVIDQEFPGCVVQSTAGVWTDIKPRTNMLAVTMNDDGFTFAVNNGFYCRQARNRQLRPGN